MRKIQLHRYLSLDGRAEFPQYPGWDDLGPEARRNFAEMWSDHYAATDTIILGRRAYEGAAAFWPYANRKPGEPRFFLDHRRFMDRCVKAVFSHDMTQANWEKTRILKGDVGTAVSQLRREPGKNMIVMGGPSIAQAFMKRGLIDEYFLTVYPTLLGEGKPFFCDLSEAQTLRLVGINRYKFGEVVLTYETLRGKAVDGSAESPSTSRNR